MNVHNALTGSGDRGRRRLARLLARGSRRDIEYLAEQAHHAGASGVDLNRSGDYIEQERGIRPLGGSNIKLLMPCSSGYPPEPAALREGWSAAQTDHTAEAGRRAESDQGGRGWERREGSDVLTMWACLCAQTKGMMVSWTGQDWPTQQREGGRSNHDHPWSSCSPPGDSRSEGTILTCDR